MTARFRRIASVAFLFAAGVGCNRVAAFRPESAGCGRDSFATGRRLNLSLDVDGQKRDYILDVPESVHAQVPVPLVFDFHGWGHSGAGVWEVSRFKELAAQRGFITVYPEGLPVGIFGRPPRAGWEIETLTDNRDLAFVRAMLDDIEARYCIDRRRIYATGFSNGGFLSHILGCAMSDRFAAVAPVSGGDLLVDCKPKRAVPVLIHHGTQDPLIPIAKAEAARDGWANRNGCGNFVTEGSCRRYTDCRDDGEIVYCEENVAHTWPSAASDRIWRFFESHPLR